MDLYSSHNSSKLAISQMKLINMEFKENSAIKLYSFI